jgi:hypothetical protein
MIPLKGFTAPHFCSYSKPYTGSQISYEVVCLYSMAWGEGLLFLLLILVELLNIEHYFSHIPIVWRQVGYFH